MDFQLSDLRKYLYAFLSYPVLDILLQQPWDTDENFMYRDESLANNEIQGAIRSDEGKFMGIPTWILDLKQFEQVEAL